MLTDKNRQIALLLVAFANIIEAKELLDSFEKSETTEEQEDTYLINQCLNEMRMKMSFWATQRNLEMANAVVHKILRGIQDHTASNVELFAGLMTIYFDEVKGKIIHFSSTFKKNVYGIEEIYMEVSDDNRTYKLTSQIASRILYGDYLEFRR